MEEQIKQIIKNNLRVITTTSKQYIEGRDGCMGYVALVTKTTVLFGDEIISEEKSSSSINF